MSNWRKFKFDTAVECKVLKKHERDWNKEEMPDIPQPSWDFVVPQEMREETRGSPVILD